MATEKEAVRSRLGELHRLLNNRKGSLNATYNKNDEANDTAHDVNVKTIQALDTLAEEYGNFEATMKKVTFEHEEGDVLYATVTEQRRLTSSKGPRKTRIVCRTNWIAHAKTWPPLPGSCPTVGPRKKRQSKRQAVPSGKSVTAVQLMRRFVSKHAGRGRKHRTLNARLRRHKKTCCPTGKEPDASPMNTPGHLCRSFHCTHFHLVLYQRCGRGYTLSDLRSA